MSLSNTLRNLILKRRIDRSLRLRRQDRAARREAALRGISNEWKRRADIARRVFSTMDGSAQ